MMVETVDVVTMTLAEMQGALIERVQNQAGLEVKTATLEPLWENNTPAAVKDGWQHLRGMKVMGVMKRPGAPEMRVVKSEGQEPT